MSKKNRHIFSSLFLLLFVWQVSFLCAGHVFQNKQVNKINATFIEELQEDETIALDQFTDDYSISDFQEILEEDNLFCSSYYFFKRITALPDNWIQENYAFNHFQNPYSPPEGIIYILVQSGLV